MGVACAEGLRDSTPVRTARPPPSATIGGASPPPRLSRARRGLETSNSSRTSGRRPGTGSRLERHPVLPTGPMLTKRTAIRPPRVNVPGLVALQITVVGSERPTTAPPDRRLTRAPARAQALRRRRARNASVKRRPARPSGHVGDDHAQPQRGVPVGRPRLVCQWSDHAGAPKEMSPIATARLGRRARVFRVISRLEPGLGVSVDRLGEAAAMTPISLVLPVASRVTTNRPVRP
jgi:hypothetical protein